MLDPNVRGLARNAAAARRRWPIWTAVIVLAGCAARLGGGPAGLQTMALQLEQPSAAEVAAQVEAAGADLVLISADRDDAWFEALAAATGLALSGPGRTGERALGFLTNLELLGDTSLALAVPGGGRIHMHDALYRTSARRLVDLMYVRYEDVASLRAATRTLLEYVATDVGANVALLLAIEASDAAATDSVAVLLRALYPTAWDCTDPGRMNAAAAELRARLFYGPAVRVRCEHAQRLPGVGTPVAARLILGG